MTDLPSTLFATAAVRSSRPGHVSLLYAPVGPTRPPVKESLADPGVVGDAVRSLKSLGFAVTGITEFTIDFAGTPELFETTFGVDLHAGVQPDSESTIDPELLGVVDTSSHAVLGQALDGFFFAPVDERFGPGPGQIAQGGTRRTLSLDELPGLLGQRRQTPVSPEIGVTVIDTGFSAGHPHFERLRRAHDSKFEIITRPDESEYTDVLARGWAIRHVQARNNEDNPDLTELEAEEQNLLQRSELLDNERADPCDELNECHGTAVVANLLALAPWAVRVRRALSFRSTTTYIADEVFRTEPGSKRVVSLSMGRTVKLGHSIAANEQAPARIMDVFLRSADRLGALVVASAGNSPLTDKPETIPAWNLSEFPLIVGGAYIGLDDVVSASPTTGYPGDLSSRNNRGVPDVCGLSGPGDADYLWVPRGSQSGHDGGWRLASGTSYATPQVAAVCAMVWSACRIASPQQVKEIVMRTATPIGGEQTTAEGYRLSEIQHSFSGTSVSPGLPNIEAAVYLARAHSIRAARRGGTSVDETMRHPVIDRTLRILRRR